MPKDWNNNLKVRRDLKSGRKFGYWKFHDLKSFSDCRINLREIQKETIL